MKEELKALNELQQIDLGIAAASRELAGLDSGANVRAHLALAEKKLAAASEELKKSESELRDKELTLKTIESKKKSFENKLYEGKVTNPKELSSIEKEIEMLGKNRSQLDVRILELYEIIENQQAEKKQVEDVQTALTERLTRTMAIHKAKSSELGVEIARLTEARKSAIAAVPDKQLLSRYEALRNRYKDTGLAKVVDGKCGGCHVGLTSFTVRKIREDKEYQTCESCGRILFLVE